MSTDRIITVNIFIVGEPDLSKSPDTKPLMVVLNQFQCEKIFNIPMRIQDDLLDAANEIHKRGVTHALIPVEKTLSNSLLAKEDEGYSIYQTDEPGSICSCAEFVSWEGQRKAVLPGKTEGATSGVCDALLTNFMCACVNEKPIEESLQFGVVTATYTYNKTGCKFGY